MNEGKKKPETAATFDLETIKENDANPSEQMVLMQLALSTHSVPRYTTQIQSSAFTTGLGLYKI